jgi:hypothetical protein
MKSYRRHILTAAAVAMLCTPLAAQDHQHGDQPKMTPEQQAMMEAYMKAGTPGEPHKALAAMAGSYDAKVKSWPGPGAPPEESTGTVTRSSALDGRVLVEEFSGAMMGMPFTGHGMMGYDNVSGKYWSTWNDSMSTGLMVSEGTCDAKGACTFAGSWNDPIKKGPVQARMTTKWTSPTVEVFEMYGPGPDGKEMKMMEITYTKK